MIFFKNQSSPSWAPRTCATCWPVLDFLHLSLIWLGFLLWRRCLILRHPTPFSFLFNSEHSMGMVTAHKRAGGSLADRQASKPTVQFGRSISKEKAPGAHAPKGLEAPPRLGAHLLAWCIGCTPPNFWPFRSGIACRSCLIQFGGLLRPIRVAPVSGGGHGHEALTLEPLAGNTFCSVNWQS